MASKVETKTGLLLSPQHLLKNISILQTLHIRKSAADVSYENVELESREINRTYPQLPNDVKQILGHFSDERAELRKSSIRTK